MAQAIVFWLFIGTPYTSTTQEDDYWIIQMIPKTPHNQIIVKIHRVATSIK